VEYNLLLGTDEGLMWKNYLKQIVRQVGSDAILKYRISNSVWFETDTWDVYSIFNEITRYLPFNTILANISNYHIKDFRVTYGMNFLSIVKSLIAEPFISIRKLPYTNTYVIEPINFASKQKPEDIFNQACIELLGESIVADLTDYGIVVVGGFGKPEEENLPIKQPLPQPLENIRESIPITDEVISQFEG